ncbi:TPA: hypothetical protein RQJ54_002742 [Vibrio vulnificus]|nr:hypothetical protein [Vibrio vulnificus]NIG84137.1 hypothetical protein [Lacticaseibacillus casei]EJU9784387.1 hypothetical protein [Vibrio vulnificus]ELV8656392.1 hypothetical protein [Vibrio vulnificus]MBF4451191.1 hypothetical protein [Vibrio vulnificus]
MPLTEGLDESRLLISREPNFKIVGIDMKKSLMSLVITSSLVLAGCSSSANNAGHSGTEATPDRLPPVWHSPEDAVNTPDRHPPLWGGPTDDGNTPDRQPPLWGGPTDDGNTPDRLPPTWNEPEQPPMWNSPLYSYVIDGDKITDANGNEYTISREYWNGHEFTVQDKDGNVYWVRRLTDGEHSGNFAVFHNGEIIYVGGDTVKGGIAPALEAAKPKLDRQAVRDTIRARINL